MKTKKSRKGIPLSSLLDAKYISKLKPLSENEIVLVELGRKIGKLESQVERLKAQVLTLMRSSKITTRH